MPPISSLIFVAALGTFALWAVFAPQKRRMGTAAPTLPTTLERLVMAAYREALMQRVSTFFLNSIDDPAEAERDFRNGLPGLADARDRALAILNNTKGV